MRAAIVVLMLAFAASVAGADAISEEQAECRGKAVGDACGTNGACVAQTCSRPLPDGTRASYDCSVCQEGAPRKAGASDASGGKGLYIGIFVAGALIVCGLAFAYTRRKPPAR